MGAIAQQPPAGVRFAQEQRLPAIEKSSVRISLGPLRSTFRGAFFVHVHDSAAAPFGGFTPFGRLGAASACH